MFVNRSGTLVIIKRPDELTRLLKSQKPIIKLDRHINKHVLSQNIQAERSIEITKFWGHMDVKTCKYHHEGLNVHPAYVNRLIGTSWNHIVINDSNKLNDCQFGIEKS